MLMMETVVNARRSHLEGLLTMITEQIDKDEETVLGQREDKLYKHGEDELFERIWIRLAFDYSKPKMKKKHFAEQVFIEQKDPSRALDMTMDEGPNEKPRRLSLREALRAVTIIGRDFARFSWEVDGLVKAAIERTQSQIQPQ